ncbi:recombinase family protein [Lawsonibacter faecis]|uniref:Recombinase family protein n=1 Tax=Lawsonibacter faecis TaxID=2763052 RepID=A0A8J6JB08_9FIRM|nr:recombinase family protein [Lawsonibacter faecis]MBC5736111.1 recombinase family protein [Lawsonibacter faecis]
MDAAEYLRKSRMEEGMDTEEVLARHRKALADYASANGINIIETYPEVKSGESLYARPEMLRLLEDVEAGKYEAVLVMDLDRLSRGRMKDQGIILDTFAESGTLIITPEKTYDLSDEMDAELAEFKTFMSRREYKIINKRLQRGLRQSINDGWYVANAPYGYRKITVDRHPTLEVVEEEAKFVRMMFELYTQGYGCVSVARHINALGARPRRSDTFTRSSIARILTNPVYVGKVAWNQKSHIKKGVRGNPKQITIYNPPEKWIVTDGQHPAIIGRELFDRAQEIMRGRYTPSKNDGTIKSPLAGLVKCARCGKNMQRLMMHGGPYLLCNTVGCCASAKFEYVEAQVLHQLREIMTELSLSKPEAVPQNIAPLEESLAMVRKEIASTGRQKDKLHELLEIGEYDLPTYRERMGKVKDKLSGLERQEAELSRAIRDADRADPPAVAKQIRAVLDAYDAADAANRNALLKSVVNVIWYTKEKKTKPRDFQLKLDVKGYL